MEVNIATLTKGRFLVVLPESLAPETLIEAVPYKIWEEGISFQKWDPMENAERINPEFRVVVDLLDIPPYLYKEKEVINAVSTFGLYLGTVAQQKRENIAAWTAVVATEKLEDVPKYVTMVVGPAKHKVQIRPVLWKKGHIYAKEDFPKPPKKFCKPPKPVIEEAEQNDGERARQLVAMEEDDMVPMSRRAIIEMCQGLDHQALPPQILAIIRGEDWQWQPAQPATRQLTQPLAIEITQPLAMEITGPRVQEGEVHEAGQFQLGNLPTTSSQEQPEA